MRFSFQKKLSQFLVYFFVLFLTVCFGGWACSGLGGGGAGSGAGAPGTLGANSASGTISPPADLSTPMDHCRDKAGKIVPCSSLIRAMMEKKDYDNDYRAYAKNASNFYELITRDYKFVSPLRFNREGEALFLLEQFTQGTAGDPSTWDWHQFPDDRVPARLIILPRDPKGDYRYVDSTVEGAIKADGGYNLSFKKMEMSFGDTVELWLYKKPSEDKKSFHRAAGFNVEGSSFDEKGYKEFIEDSDSFFLGTFRFIEDLKDVEVFKSNVSSPIDHLGPVF